MRGRAAVLSAVVALLVGSAVVQAHTVTYTGDSPGTGPNASFSWSVTTVSFNITQFGVTVWPADDATKYTGITQPSGWDAGIWVPDLSVYISGAPPAPGIYWAKPGLPWTGTGTFGFSGPDSYVGPGDQSAWYTGIQNGTQSGPTNGPVPEPGALLLFGGGLLGLMALRKRRARACPR